MCDIKYNEGNYLWDKNNDSLIRCGDCSTIKSIGKVNVASPIALTDDLLALLNFAEQTGQSIFIHSNYPNIRIMSTSTGYCMNNQTHRLIYLNDLQDEFQNLGIELEIDEILLEKYCKNK